MDVEFANDENRALEWRSDEFMHAWTPTGRSRPNLPILSRAGSLSSDLDWLVAYSTTPAAGVDDEHLTYALTNWRSGICLARLGHDYDWFLCNAAGAGCSRCGILDCPLSYRCLVMLQDERWQRPTGYVFVDSLCCAALHLMSDIFPGFGVVMCRREEWLGFVTYTRELG